MKNIFFGALLFFSMNLMARPIVHFEMDCMNEEDFSIQLWCQRAKVKMIEWYPRFKNIMGRKITKEIQYIEVFFTEAKDPGERVGNRIFLSREWASKHKNDIGIAIHELIHVMQNYQGYGPTWLMEGIADYYRWAIFEGKSLSDFPIGNENAGFKQGYQCAAGFLYWLESTINQGIIKKLDSSLNHHRYKDELFQKFTGRSLEQLWSDYFQSRIKDKLSERREL